MNKAFGNVVIAAVLFASLTACTVSGPEVRITPPIHVDVVGVEVEGGHHHRHHHHHYDD